MRRKSAIAVACLTFFMCMTTVTHAKETVTTTRVNTVAKTGWQFSNGNWYYYDTNGNIQTDWISYGGRKYYLHPNGTMAKGWVFTNGHYQYLNDFGIQQTGWQMINGNWYHFDENGDMETGWIIYNGRNYYMRPSGEMATGWVYTNDYYQYLDAFGIQKYGWQNVYNTWYYLGDDGNMQTGWLNLSQNHYYCNSSGAMLTGWQFINGNWYYMASSGIMLSGWQYINGHWYYLGDSNDGSMKSGWQIINGTTYYFKANGMMAENGWLLENGTWYHFRAGGAHDYTQTTAPTLTYDNGYYVSPMKTGNFNTSAERIEAMIARAYEYLGTTYRICTSSYPGDGVDCSGLVMQALYAAGFDPYPATPSHHAKPENEYDSRTLWAYTPMAHVPTSDLRRGDLVFYSSGPYAPIFHVAIYLGNGKVIEAWPPYVTDTCGVTDWPHPYILGVARPFE